MGYNMGALDLDKVLGKAHNRILKAGIELEGGWTRLPPGLALVHDGSVIIPAPEPSPAEVALALQEGRRIRQSSTFKTGELVSEPLETEGNFSKVGAWIKKHYPDKVNETCGLHVHMSFKSVMHYSSLMTPAYDATGVEYLRRWAEEERLPTSHPIWARLRGENTACQLEYAAEQQVTRYEKDRDRRAKGSRYTAFNRAWRRLTTLECRLLPMFDDPDQAVRAVKRVLDLTNAALVVLGAQKREKVTSTTIIVPGDEVYQDEVRHHV